MKGIFNILDNSNNSNNFTTLQNARIDIIGEMEAIINYATHLNQTNLPVAIETIKDITQEEKLHVGQLFGLVFYLDPESKTLFEKGLEEFNKTLKD